MLVADVSWMLPTLLAGVGLSALSYLVTHWCVDGRPVLPAEPESRPVEDATVTADRPTAPSGRRG